MIKHIIPEGFKYTLEIPQTDKSGYPTIHESDTNDTRKDIYIDTVHIESDMLINILDFKIGNESWFHTGKVNVLHGSFKVWKPGEALTISICGYPGIVKMHIFTLSKDQAINILKRRIDGLI